jgi:hypothetical protein
MNLLESGYLFTAGDCSNHIIYRLNSLGDEDEEVPISTSNMPFDDGTDHSKLVRFCPKSELVNLSFCDEMPNIASINDMLAADLMSGAPTEEHSK